MVGWLHWSDEKIWRTQVRETHILGFPLLEASLPAGDPKRRLRQGAKALARRGIRRVLLPAGLADEAVLTRYGLRPVDPLSLCRAKGAELALALLAGIPVRDRCMALRGERADGPARMLADALCPQVGALLLDFGRGEEALSNHLRSRYGAPPRSLGQGPPAQISVELAPCGEPVGRPLKLWGAPDLLGLELSIGADLPADLPPLFFLTLLWEGGRVKDEDILVLKP